MSQQKPPSHYPPGGLIPASAEEVLADVAESNPPGSPWWTGHAFHAAVTREDGQQITALHQLVTPESLAAWGDFAEARKLLHDTGMTSRADEPGPGVAYVKFVSDTGEGYTAVGPVAMMVRAAATLQFRPELGGWRVHALGGALPPEELPPLPS